MSQLAPSPDPAPLKRSTLDKRALHLRVVDSDREERADLVQQCEAFKRRCEAIATPLASTSEQSERIALYASGDFSYRELSSAAALFPDLMPVLNGEWEWLAFNAE